MQKTLVVDIVEPQVLQELRLHLIHLQGVETQEVVITEPMQVRLELAQVLAIAIFTAGQP